MSGGDDRELLSLRAYAKHRRERKLPGVSLFSVQKALRDGRIARTCAEHERCPLGCAKGGIDPLVADTDWNANSQPGAASKGGTPGVTGGNPELLAAKIAREVWAGRNERLLFEQRAGNVVRVDQVQANLLRKARQVREQLQQLRPRLAPRLALEKDPKAVGRILDDAVREILEAISWELEG